MNRKIFIYFLAISAVLMGCTSEQPSLKKTMDQPNAIRVETRLVSKPQQINDLLYSGIIVPAKTFSLNFKTPGTVESIHIDEGDAVKKGQTLATLDETSFKSIYQAAMASKTQAKDAYNRLKLVHDKGSLPDIQWEEMKSKLEQAKSSEQVASQNLKNCTLTAPSDGIIGSRNVEVGENILPGISAFNLVTIKEVYVRISVPENEINKISKGQTGEVVIQAISPTAVQATVEKIGVSANPISKTYEVKLILPNPDLKIKPGMACDVRININEESPYLSVPFQSVLTDLNGDKFVYLVDKQSDKAIRQMVRVAGFSDNEIQISSGLRPGDRVVISGQDKLSNNELITY
ncbi:MAG: efflux RND transporter periplasmic adaptor subunit [Bacteroidales bacterium]